MTASEHGMLIYFLFSSYHGINSMINIGGQNYYVMGIFPYHLHIVIFCIHLSTVLRDLWSLNIFGHSFLAVQAVPQAYVFSKSIFIHSVYGKKLSQYMWWYLLPGSSYTSRTTFFPNKRCLFLFSVFSRYILHFSKSQLLLSANPQDFILHFVGIPGMYYFKLKCPFKAPTALSTTKSPLGCKLFWTCPLCPPGLTL